MDRTRSCQKSQKHLLTGEQTRTIHIILPRVDQVSYHEAVACTTKVDISLDVAYGEEGQIATVGQPSNFDP